MISITRLYCGGAGPGDSIRYGEASRAPHGATVRSGAPPKSAAERRPVVVWNCTRSCNLKCLHCYTDSDARRYEGERFVRVMPFADPAVLDEGFFDVQACNDTNNAELFVFANASQVLLVSRLDNLGKNASGAAVQAMNVHLGLDESLGLV